MSDQPIDQTTFVESVGLQDDASNTSTPTPKLTAAVDDTEKPMQPVKKRLPTSFKILGGVLIFFIILLVLAFTLPRSSSIHNGNTPAATDSPSIGKPLPESLQKSIDTMQSTIQSSDPSSNDLPFPPVNFQLHLIPPQPGQ